MGVPLTSQEKSGLWYIEFNFLDKKEFAAICQARVMSISRLHEKMGRIPELDLQNIKEAFCKLYG